MRYIAIPTLLLAILLAACAGFRPEKEATVLAIPPENAQPKQEETYTLKRKVAIGRFTNDSRLATSFLNEGSDTAERLSRAANDILSAKLAATNRFLLIERADLQALENEQDYAQITSHKIPADYLILGSISEFGRNTTGNVGLVDRSKKQTAHAKVTLRIVDTRTGQVIFGEEGRGEAYSETASVLGMGSTASYDDTLPDSDRRRHQRRDPKPDQQAQQRSLKSYVLNVEQDKVFISGGALQDQARRCVQRLQTRQDRGQPPKLTAHRTARREDRSNQRGANDTGHRTDRTLHRQNHRRQPGRGG